MHKKELPQKKFGAFSVPKVAFPDLVAHQRDSFEWLIKKGLSELLKEFSPISDYSGKKFELSFEGFELGAPKYDEEYARENLRTYEAPLKVTVRLTNKTLGTEKEQEMFLADLPMMTLMGVLLCLVLNESLFLSLPARLVRFFIAESVKGRNLFGAKIIPARGVWIELESDADGVYLCKD